MCESRIYLRWGGEAGKRKAAEWMYWQMYWQLMTGTQVLEKQVVLCPERVALLFALNLSVNMTVRSLGEHKAMF